MNAVTDPGTTEPDAPTGAATDTATASPVRLTRDTGSLAELAVALVAGAGLVLGARAGATPLLVAVAVVQGVLAVAWIVGTHQPGRIGGLVIAALAAGAADVLVSVWPQGGLGACVAVLGLAVPVMFVHQLARGAARVQLVTSLSGIALLVLAQVALAAYVQLRHELDGPTEAGRIVAAAAGAIAIALVAGYLVDLVLPAPRFDPAVPRGLPAVVVSAAVGSAFAYLTLRGGAGGREFTDGRAAFVGVALGALAAVLAIGASFVAVSLGTQLPAAGRWRAPARRAATALLPLALLAPVAYLLCLAVRS